MLYCNADVPNFEPENTTKTELQCLTVALFRVGHDSLRKGVTEFGTVWDITVLICWSVQGIITTQLNVFVLLTSGHPTASELKAPFLSPWFYSQTSHPYGFALLRRKLFKLF